MALDTKLRSKGQQPGCQDTSAHITSVSRLISLIAGETFLSFTSLYVALCGISPVRFHLFQHCGLSPVFYKKLEIFHKQDRPLRSREQSAFLVFTHKHSHVHLTQSAVPFNMLGNHITRLVPAAHDTGSGPIHAVMKRDSTPNPFKTLSPRCST